MEANCSRFRWRWYRNAADTDDDGDGVADTSDAFLLTPNVIRCRFDGIADGDE